jgi:hypothetical protein
MNARIAPDNKILLIGMLRIDIVTGILYSCIAVLQTNGAAMRIAELCSALFVIILPVICLKELSQSDDLKTFVAYAGIKAAVIGIVVVFGYVVSFLLSSAFNHINIFSNLQAPTSIFIAWHVFSLIGSLMLIDTTGGTAT